MYIGIRRSVYCTWTGQENITQLYFYIVGLRGLTYGLRQPNYSFELLTSPFQNMVFNGDIFVCRVNTTNGRIVEKNFTLILKGNYIKHL